MITTLVVGQVTPQLQKEIQAELSGSVRQVCVSPRLYLVQIPYQHRPAEPVPTPTGDLGDACVDLDSMEDDIEVGGSSGQGYLRVRSTGWMCEYRQHPHDITQTALRSMHEPPQEKREGVNANEGTDADQPGARQRAHWPVERRPDDEELARRWGRMLVSAIKEEDLSAYERYTWAVARDPATFQGNEERRRAFQAWIAMGSYGNLAVRETIAAVQQELDELDEEEATEVICDIVEQVTADAEALIFSLPGDELEFIAHFEVELQLRALREGILTEKELDMALTSFGEYKLLEARPDVERCLTYPTPAIRRRALETLVMGLGLSEDTEIAFRFLDDPDPGCRRQGMRCLNPGGKVIEDLRILTAYARIAADREEARGVRLCAYSELLAAVGYRLDHDNWEEIDWFLESGGSLEQAPWIDWKLVQFFLEETSEDCPFQVGLAFHTSGDWTEWVDQHGRVFYTPEELGQDVLHPAHRIIRTRLSDYQMTISVAPLPPTPHRPWEDSSGPAQPVPS